MLAKERERIKVRLNTLIEYLQSNPNYTIASLTLDTVLLAKRIRGVSELFDRMIVATALEHDAVLLTCDSAFQNVSAVKIVW